MRCRLAERKAVTRIRRITSGMISPPKSWVESGSSASRSNFVDQHFGAENVDTHRGQGDVLPARHGVG